MIMDEVSARINQILEERKMTKFDLYKKCEDVSRASVYNAANGNSIYQKGEGLERSYLRCSKGFSVSPFSELWI